MRVFVGIPLSEELKEKIEKWQEKYTQEFTVKDIHWITKKNLHITILPPWKEEHPDQLIKILQRQSFPASCTISFRKIVTMPFRSPKYIWAQGNSPQELLMLRSLLAQLAGQQLEKRAFRLHTTLARVKKQEQILPFEQQIDWSMQVTCVNLFQSHLAPEQGEYETLISIPLR